MRIPNTDAKRKSDGPHLKIQKTNADGRNRAFTVYHARLLCMFEKMFFENHWEFRTEYSAFFVRTFEATARLFLSAEFRWEIRNEQSVCHKEGWDPFGFRGSPAKSHKLASKHCTQLASSRDIIWPLNFATGDQTALRTDNTNAHTGNAVRSQLASFQPQR